MFPVGQSAPTWQYVGPTGHGVVLHEAWANAPLGPQQWPFGLQSSGPSHRALKLQLPTPPSTSRQIIAGALPATQQYSAGTRQVDDPQSTPLFTPVSGAP